MDFVIKKMNMSVQSGKHIVYRSITHACKWNMCKAMKYLIEEKNEPIFDENRNGKCFVLEEACRYRSVEVIEYLFSLDEVKQWFGNDQNENV